MAPVAGAGALGDRSMSAQKTRREAIRPAGHPADRIGTAVALAAATGAVMGAGPGRRAQAGVHGWRPWLASMAKV